MSTDADLARLLLAERDERHAKAVEAAKRAGHAAGMRDAAAILFEAIQRADFEQPESAYDTMRAALETINTHPQKPGRPPRPPKEPKGAEAPSASATTGPGRETTEARQGTQAFAT